MRAVGFVLETLAHFIKQEAGPPPGVPARVDPEFERRLVRLCEWHGLAPLVLDSIQRLALRSSLSEVTLKRLGELSNRAGAQNERLLAALRPLIRQLRERRVPFLLVDDVMAAITLYPRHRLRPIEALDMLIHESDWDRLIGVCRGMGYRREATAPNFADGSEAMLYHQYLSPCVLRGDRGSAIGVKFRLVDVGRPPENESAWVFGKRVIRDVEAMRVSYEDQLVRSCVGFALTGFGKLLHAVDVGRIITRRGDDLDWAQIEGLARDRSFYPAFYFSYETILNMFGFPAKRGALPRPGAVRKSVFDMVWRPGRIGALEDRPPARHPYRLCLLEIGTPADRIDLLKNVLLPRKEWVSGFFGRPSRPWLRAKFVALALRNRIGARLEGGEGSGPA